MFAMNFISFFILFISTTVSTEIFGFIQFVQEYPYVLKYMVMNILAGSIGQVFIFWMIIAFGALPCTIVTTVRKCINVVISLLYFGNSLEIYQWIGSVIVILALALDVILSNNEFKSKAKVDQLAIDQKKVLEQQKYLLE